MKTSVENKRRGAIRSPDCQALDTPNASWNTGFAGRLTPLTGKNRAASLGGQVQLPLKVDVQLQGFCHLGR